MNSTKKSKCINNEPLFKFDPETGKDVLLPLKWLVPQEAKANVMSDKTKRKIVITPLRLSDFEDELPNKAAKTRKTDSVRKGLFNLPPTNRSSTGCRTTLSRRSITKTRKIQPKRNQCELSPLLDMEEAEEELLNKNTCFKGYPFRTPSKPSIKFTKETKSSPFTKKVKLEKKSTPKKDVVKTPESTSSNETEFLELEKMCCIDQSDKENNHSPISSVCNLLEGTILGSAKKHTISKNNVINVQVAICNIENILEVNKRAFDQYKTTHEENLSKIVELLDNDRAEYGNLIALEESNKTKIENIISELKDFCTKAETDDKENLLAHNRRSVRLLNKSPKQNSKTKMVVSPVIIKSGDLRKTTLTKNLVAKTQQYNIQSPRIQKALDMYNSMRGEISILATPKLDRKSLLESPKSSNMSRMLSRRVQSQCLLLQDTPVHKN